MENTYFGFWNETDVYPYIPWKILRPCGSQQRQAERKDRRQYLRCRGTWSSKLLRLRLRCEAVIADDSCIQVAFVHAGHTHTCRVITSDVVRCMQARFRVCRSGKCTLEFVNTFFSYFPIRNCTPNLAVMWTRLPCQTHSLMFIIMLYLFPTVETRCWLSYCDKRHRYRRISRFSSVISEC